MLSKGLSLPDLYARPVEEAMEDFERFKIERGLGSQRNEINFIRLMGFPKTTRIEQLRFGALVGQTTSGVKIGEAKSNGIMLYASDFPARLSDKKGR